jgi:hypothetical protein
MLIENILHMPTLQEFLSGFGIKETILTILVFGIIILAREGSSLGVLKRRKNHATTSSGPSESPQG